MNLKNLVKKAGDVAKKVDVKDIKNAVSGGNVKEIITGFLQPKKPDVKLDGDTDLFEKGFVNSLYALEIVSFIEKTFKIKVGKGDITKDNLSSINKITSLVEKLKK